MKKIKLIVLLLLISVFSSIEAKENLKKETKVPEKEEKVPDFSRGFAMFHKLGVPDVSEMTYIKLKDGAYYNRSSKMTGNAWLIKDNGDDGIIVLKNNVKTKFHNLIKVRKQRMEEIKALAKKFKGKAEKLAEATRLLDLKYAKMRSATYKKADLKKDVATLYKNLVKGEKSDRNRYGAYRAGPGELFIFAIHIHDKGFKREANKAASLLFKSKGKKEILVSVINQLATDLYAGIYKDFCKTKNWAKYSSQLDALIKKMPSAWIKEPVIKLLATRIKERIAGKIPKLTGKGLSPEDLKIAQDLVNTKSFPRLHGPWTLPPSEEAETYNKTALPENKVFKEIFAARAKSIPLLIALLKDTYLTSLIREQNRYRQQMFFNPQETDPINPEKAYASMQTRPLSRGDIARILLNSILPEKERSFGADEEDDTAARALELYKEFKDKNAEEIAAYYLENGAYMQKTAAVNYLSKADKPKYISMLEKYFIDNAGMNSRHQVTQYLETRGAKAKEFVEKYLVALKGSLKKQLKQEARYAKDKEALNRARKRLDKQYKDVEKNFKKFLSSETAEQLLMKIAAKKKWDDSDYEVLRFKCKKLSFDKLVPLFLKAAIAAKNAKVKYNLLAYIQSLNYGTKKTKFFEDFKGTKSLWLKLINDKTIITDTADYTAGKYTLFTIEMISKKEVDPSKDRELMMLPDVHYNALLKRRALARFDGKNNDEIPPLPDASKVSDAEYKKVVDKLLKTPVPELSEELKKLSDNMFLKLAASLEKNQPLNKKLLRIANKITKVDNKIKDKNILKNIPEIKGDLDEKMVRKIFASVKNIKLKKQYVSCLIRANSGLDGITVKFSLKDKIENKYSKVDYISGTVSSTGNYVSCSWIITKIKDDKKAKGSDEDDDLFAEAEEDIDEDASNELAAKQKDFWEAVKKFQNRTNAMQRGTIYFRY